MCDTYGVPFPVMIPYQIHQQCLVLSGSQMWYGVLVLNHRELVNSNIIISATDMFREGEGIL